MSTTTNGYQNDPEDMFHHTRMSLGDHIEELRRHMIKALLGFGVAMVIGFFISKPVLEFINAPVEKALLEMYEERRNEKKKEYLEKLHRMAPEEKARPVTLIIADTEAARQLGAKDLDPAQPGWVGLPSQLSMETILDLAPPEELTSHPPTLTSLQAQEVFMVYMKVSVYCGIVLSSPWIFYQMWMFVAAGLYPHEKKYVHVWLPFSLVLFLCGVALCEFVVLPVGLNYLLGFNKWMGIQPELRLSEWLSFAIMMPLIFGAAFQTPLIMFFLERVGIVDVAFYQKHRRVAIFVLALAAALLAVSPDPLSMMAMAIPLWALYELGILLCKLNPKRKLDLDVPETEEMIEV
jgi:sec-independent protein translocase protein TatC